MRITQIKESNPQMQNMPKISMPVMLQITSSIKTRNHNINRISRNNKIANIFISIKDELKNGIINSNSRLLGWGNYHS